MKRLLALCAPPPSGQYTRAAIVAGEIFGALWLVGMFFAVFWAHNALHAFLLRHIP